MGYYLMELTELEFSAADIFNRTVIPSEQDIAVHDQLYSLNLVQALLPKSWGFQPYVKVGLGQLIRELSGNYADGTSLESISGSLSGILGAGLRLYVSRDFSIRSEATTYLTAAAISSWQDNLAFSVGLSYYF